MMIIMIIIMIMEIIMEILSSGGVRRVRTDTH